MRLLVCVLLVYGSLTFVSPALSSPVPFTPQGIVLVLDDDPWDTHRSRMRSRRRHHRRFADDG